MISRTTTLLLLILAVLPASLATSRRMMTSHPGVDYSATLALLDGVSIPAEIVVPSGHVAHLALSAEGHQHYRFNGTAWVLFNATAKLYADAENSVEVGRHYFLGQPDANGGQPTWETVDDGHHDGTYTSVVTAKGVSAVSVDSDSITWNILEATSHGGNTYEPFGGVTYVQRLQTYKGLPPSTTSNINLGDTHDSKYKALYVFYIQQ